MLIEPQAVVVGIFEKTHFSKWSSVRGFESHLVLVFFFFFAILHLHCHNLGYLNVTERPHFMLHCWFQLEVICSWVHLAAELQSLEASLYRNERLKDQPKKSVYQGQCDEIKCFTSGWKHLESLFFLFLILFVWLFRTNIWTGFRKWCRSCTPTTDKFRTELSWPLFRTRN